MTELFDIPESLSPRLKWMKENYITIVDDGEEAPPEKRYRAKHGMASITAGPDEITACIKLCQILNKKGWEG
jgi:hypothetical protein